MLFDLHAPDFVTIGLLVVLEGLLSADNALVELVNLAFSIDSILVAVAMSRKLAVVLAGGILGIIAMRLVVGQLLQLIRRYPALVDGAFVIIGWVAIKLIAEYLHDVELIHWDIPRSLSLGLIVVIFVVAFLYARRRPPPPETPDGAPGESTLS